MTFGFIPAVLFFKIFLAQCVYKKRLMHLLPNIIRFRQGQKRGERMVFQPFIGFIFRSQKMSMATKTFPDMLI